MPDYALDELTMRDGVLVLLNPTLPPTEYLATPPVRITAKSQLVELESDEVSYLFTLDHFVDSTWIEIFSAHLAGLSADAHGSQIDLRCMPEELERSFAALKDTVARTNREYSELKANLSARVAELDGERRAAGRAKEERSKALAHQFDRLEL